MSANTEEQENRHSLDTIKWIVVAILLLGAIIGNYLYRDVLLPIRVLAVIVFIVIAGSVALLTKKGKVIIIFAREARAEIRKVVWPTSRETLYTTLIVVAVTTVMSLILWGLDVILVRLISFITSLRF